MNIIPLSSADSHGVAHLLDLCFGPARARRTAAIVRQGAQRLPQASFAAVEGGAILGSVDVHALDWVHPGGTVHPLAWLGPLVSHPDRRGETIGVQLMDRAVAALDAMGLATALIGDAPYYQRWGFSADATTAWLMPGPVDRARLLLRATTPALFSGPAMLRPATALPAGTRHAA